MNAARNSVKPVHYPTMMFTGVGTSIVIMAVYKLWLQPHQLRQQRAANELCADTLLGPLVPKPDDFQSTPPAANQ